jgi:glutamine synthetase
MPAELTIEDLTPERFDTVVVAGADMQGRLFGRRLPARRFLADPSQGVDICTCVFVWDIAEDPGGDVPFAGPHTGWNDLVLTPDLTTLRPYPGVEGTAICLADVRDEHGEPLAMAPRTMLRRQVERASALGFGVQTASELEFYLFRGSVREARLRGFRDLEPTTLVRSDYSIVGQAAQEPFIHRVRREMDAAGIPIWACQAEYGLGQWEVNLEHADPIEMADRHVVYKAGLKEMALQDDLAATFMARPVATDMGSSGHVHVSLWRGDEPAFAGGDGPHALSEAGRSFVGGLLAHLDETALFFAPYVNSYKRHLTEDFGGGIEAWGFDNRTIAIRVVGSGSSLRVEHRYPGADANPYLSMAAVLGAGLDGIERGLDPGPPFGGDAYGDAQLRRTPRSLVEALVAFEESAFVRDTFGKDVVEHYAAHGRGEWEASLRAVTDWEVNRAFEQA